ncbi:MAG: hypothetical protein EBS75_10400 [Betaproteobacteria bacterium]|nr:hypothetical protein [Betaproteobacteria bacterium]
MRDRSRPELIRMLKAFPIVLALAILCAAMAREVKAWGFELHELIARQAQAMLSQQAKTMLESLLAQEEGASRLDTLRPERMGEGRNPMEPWALESCRIVAEDGFYPSSREVDQAYVQKHRPTLVRRLAQASRRLAETLNRVAAAR